MNTHCVLDMAGITAGVGDHYRNIASASGLQHHIIAPSEPLNSERQSTELVLAIRIGAGDIEDKLGLELPQR